MPGHYPDRCSEHKSYVPWSCHSCRKAYLDPAGGVEAIITGWDLTKISNTNTTFKMMITYYSILSDYSILFAR